MSDGAPPPPRKSRKPKRIRLQVADHLDLNLTVSLYASPRAMALIMAITGTGGSGIWLLIR